MNKTLLTLTLGLGLSISATAQSYEFLDVNGVSAGFHSTGDIGWDLTGSPGFEVPQGSGSHTIFAGHIWLGGQDLSGGLHVAAHQYRNSGVDFYPGPVMDMEHYDAERPNWDRVWEISRAEIEDHIANLGQPNYVPTPAILQWPGNGDVALGMAATLAPFEDVDGSGNYTPLGGDYPIIKGDRAIFMLFNDDWVHTETGGNSFRAEVHALAYGFDAVDPELANTVFVEYSLINRSTSDYVNCHLGLFADVDLGNGMDDFTGCDVERSMFYTYNGDAVDEDSFGSTGYGANPPVQGVVLLEGPLADTDGTDNGIGVAAGESVNGKGYDDGIVDNERLGLGSFMYFNNSANVAQGSPSNAIEYWNLLNAHWLDGTPLTYAGNGHSLSSTDATSFAYPGTSDPLGYGTGGNPQAEWTEATAGLVPSDRRGVGAAGPFTFNAGEVVTTTVAFVFSRDPNGDPLTLLEDMVDDLQTGFDDGTLGGLPALSASDAVPGQETGIHIGPNPANESFSVLAPTEEPMQLQIVDVLGKTVHSTRISGAGPQRINIQSLPAGAYTVVVSNGINSYSERLLKQR